MARDLNWPPRTPEEKARWAKRDAARKRYIEMMRARAARQETYSWADTTPEDVAQSIIAPGPAPRRYATYKQLSFPFDPPIPYVGRDLGQGSFTHVRVRDVIQEILAPWASRSETYVHPKYLNEPHQPIIRSASRYNFPYPLSRDPNTGNILSRRGRMSFADIKTSLEHSVHDAPRAFTKGFPDDYLDSDSDRFDVPSWFEAGANPADFFEAAKADSLKDVILAGQTPDALLALSKRDPATGEKLFQDIFDFYGRQFFSYRKEGADKEEHFKSLIGQTSIGQFIEEALQHQVERYDSLRAHEQESALDKLIAVYQLKGQYQTNQIGYKAYSEGSNILWDSINAHNANIRLYRSKYEEYRRAGLYNSGPQNITKQAREFDFNLIDWDEVLRERNLSKNKRIVVSRVLEQRKAGQATFGIMELFGHHPGNLDDRYRALLNAMEGGLGDRYIPLSKAEQILKAERRRIQEVNNLLRLHAATVIGPDAPEIISRATGAYGLVGRIQKVVDLNKWEKSPTGEPVPIPHAASGLTPKLGAIITPSDVVSKNFLGKLGLVPAGVPDLPPSDVLRVMKLYPANPMWYGGENEEMAQAADMVYGRISRGIRRLVSDTMQKIGPGSVPTIDSADNLLYKTIVGPDEIVSAETVAQQLVAYYHAIGHVKKPFESDDPKKVNEYAKAIKNVFTQAEEGDVFAQRVKTILGELAPGIKKLKIYKIDGDWRLQKDFYKNYAQSIESTLRAVGLPTQKSLGAQVMDTYEQITRPRSINERREAVSAAAEVQLAEKPFETRLLSNEPLSTRIDSATDLLADQDDVISTALKMHDLDIQAKTLKAKLDTLTATSFIHDTDDGIALRRMVSEKLNNALAELFELQKSLHHKSIDLEALQTKGLESFSKGLTSFGHKVYFSLKMSTPMRAAEYYRAGLPGNHMSTFSDYMPEVSPLIGPEFNRLVRVLSSDHELDPGWRRSYMLSRYGKNIFTLEREQQLRRFTNIDNSEDFFGSLNAVGPNAAKMNGIEMKTAFQELGRRLSKRYKMPEVRDIINTAIKGDDPSFGLRYVQTMQQFRSNLRMYEGHNFLVTGGPFQQFYEALGGSDKLKLTLENVVPSSAEIDDRFPKNKSAYTEGETVTGKFILPEELSQEDKIRTLAAMKIPEFMEKWKQNPAMSQITDPFYASTTKGLLSENAIAMAMAEAEDILNRTDQQFHHLITYSSQELQAHALPEINADEENAIVQHYMNILEASTGVKTEPIIDPHTKKFLRDFEGNIREREVPEEVTQEGRLSTAEYLAWLERKFGSRTNWGRVVIPVSNEENISRLVPLEKLAADVGPRNKVTENRFARNLAAAQHYMNWNRKYNPLTYGKNRNMSLSSFNAMPMINGERLTEQFFSEAREEIDTALRAQGANFQLLEDLSSAMGEKGIWLKQVPKNIGDMVQDIVGSENILGPLALGQKVDIGSGLTEPLSDLWGRYLMMRSYDKTKLLDLAQNSLQINFGNKDPNKLRSSSIFKLIQEQHGVDISPEAIRAQMVSHFMGQIGLLQNEDVLKAMETTQRNRIIDAFKQSRIEIEQEKITGQRGPRPGEEGRRVEDIGREAQEELAAARETTQKSAYHQVKMEDIVKLWGNKNVRRGTITLGAFALWGLIRSHQDKERTLASMQGPQNLPGGNTPYTRDIPPPITALPASSYAEPNLNAPGYIYRIRATGDINPDQFQSQIMQMTNSPINSGSIYDNRAMPNPDNDMHTTIDQYQ